MQQKTYVLGLQDGDGHFVSIGGVNEALPVSTGCLVWNPARLLGIIRLGLQLDPQLGGNNQPWIGIWVRSIRLLDMARHCCCFLLIR